MPKDCTSVVYEGYTFVFAGHRHITVESKIKGDEKELEAITRAYKIYKYRYKHTGRRLSGEWRWCLNPQCNNAFYALRSRIDKGWDRSCSQRCSGMITGYQKGHQIGESSLRKVSCKHHWIIDAPDEPISRGICKLCGAEKEFENFIPAINWRQISIKGRPSY